MSPMVFLGISIGIFIGVLAGVLFLFILRNGFRGKGSPKDLALLAVQLTALATFSLGGQWFAQPLLRGVEIEAMRSTYWGSFAGTFFLIVSKILFSAVIRLGNEIGRQEAAHK